MDWLAHVFGFVEQERMVDEGVLSHGEMQAVRLRPPILARRPA